MMWYGSGHPWMMLVLFVLFWLCVAGFFIGAMFHMRRFARHMPPPMHGHFPGMQGDSAMDIAPRALRQRRDKRRRVREDKEEPVLTPEYGLIREGWLYQPPLLRCPLVSAPT